jgi:small GTP-binding protein
MSSLTSIEEASQDKAMTGIQLLDEKLDGGFPRNSALLLFSEIPAEKRIFAEHFVMAGVKNNEKCLYVDFFRAPQLARREFTKFGTYPEEKLIIVDATSSQLLLPCTEKYSIKDVGNLQGIFDVVSGAIREMRPQRIVIDSMEFLADRFPEENVLEFWRKLGAEAREVGSTICYLFIRWTHDSQWISSVMDMADYVVEFQSIISGGVVRSLMRIEELKDGGFKTNWVPYTFKDIVGVTVYFPRVLVTGPPDAGKSTVVKNLCNTSVSIDRMGTTVAFDYGNVDTMGLEAEVFGTPGQERFEFIFKIFAQEVNGILLVVDASRPEDFQKAKSMLELVGPGLPFVIVANKSELPNALAPERIREAIGLDKDVQIVSTVATRNVGLKEAFKLLAQQIIGVK